MNRIFSLFTLGLILISCKTSQNASLALPESEVVYKGYGNVVQLRGVSGEEYQILCNDCDTAYQMENKLNYFIQVPDSIDVRVLHVQAVDRNGDEVCTAGFHIREMPNPEIYLDGSLNGLKIKKSARYISVKYGPSVPIMAVFNVKNWTLSYGDEQVHGYGASLNSEALDLLQSREPSDIISLMLEVIGPNGKTQRMGASFEIE